MSGADPTAALGRPVIGLTTYRQRAQSGVWDVEAAFLPAVYLEAVTRTGGAAVLLPPQPADAELAAEVVGRLDGLIVAGGSDVDPARYGAAPHPATDAPRPLRDDWESALLQAAIDAGLPFLGICRGLQMLNIHRGGSLIQHLPTWSAATATARAASSRGTRSRSRGTRRSGRCSTSGPASW